jgi:hypothetical protein
LKALGIGVGVLAVGTLVAVKIAASIVGRLW